MARVFDIGDTVRLRCEFRDILDALADPTTIVLQVKDPSLNEATEVAVTTATGVYTFDLAVDEAGEWWFRFVGTGAVAAAGESKFEVRPSAFTVP